MLLFDLAFLLIFDLFDNYDLNFHRKFKIYFFIKISEILRNDPREFVFQEFQNSTHMHNRELKSKF